MKIKFILYFTITLIALNTSAQIRTDYTKGMVFPEKIDLSEIAPNGIKTVKLKYLKKAQMYRMRINPSTDYFLHPTEMDHLMQNVWGNKSITEKKEYLKTKFISKGMKFEKGTYYVNYKNTRWFNNILSKGISTPYVLGLTYEDASHPLYGIVLDPYILEYENIDISSLLNTETDNIAMCQLCNSPYKFGMKGYTPSTCIKIRFKNQPSTDCYMKALDKESSMAISKILLGEYSLKDKKAMLKYMLTQTDAYNAAEKSSKWKFFSTAKKNEKFGFTLPEIINLITPGYFSESEIEDWKKMPPEAKKFIKAIVLNMGTGPTNMELALPQLYYK